MKKKQHSVHSRRVGVATTGELVAHGIVADVEGKQIEYPTPARVSWFTDFLGDALPTEINTAVGSDVTGTVPSFAISAAENGVGLITTGDSAGTMAADGVNVNFGVLNFKASQKPAIEVRLKLSAITSCALFVGFTDTVSLEAPATLSGTTYTTNASDAFGILFDSAATTDTFRIVGVKADVDATHVDTGKAPVANTYVTLRVEADDDGVLYAFINGERVGSLVANGVTTTVALTPVISLHPNSAASLTSSVDYIHVASDRT